MFRLEQLKHKYPQNYILRNPIIGSLIFMVFCFLFVVIYRPMKTHASQNLSYATTLGVYLLSWAISVYIMVRLLPLIPFFSKKSEWTFIKEISAILLILAGTGITTFFMAYIMEAPADRWNIRTFLDSCKYPLFIGIFPFGLFTLLNYRHLFVEEVLQEFANNPAQMRSAETETKIQIISKLKKEELSFFPNQLIYVESEGNYSVFHLSEGQKVRKELIRNSITDIERQLSAIPYFIRVHRAFIVNVKKVCSKKGNTLGYRLRMVDSDAEIPVSRNNVSSFDILVKQYR